jgi:hypothetical protein
MDVVLTVDRDTPYLAPSPALWKLTPAFHDLVLTVTNVILHEDSPG